MRNDEHARVPDLCEPAWLMPDWPSPPGVHALSTLRTGGVSLVPYESLNLGAQVGDDPASVAINRRRLAMLAGLPTEPSWLTQVHGNGVVALAGALSTAGLPTGGTPSATPAQADASWTRSPAQVCAVLTADCLPVLFATESGDAVAAAHAGWRGLSCGVLEATVKALAVAPATLLVWMGPAIGPKHFEVGPEVREAFLREDAGAVAAFKQNSRGRWMADLFLLARRRLVSLGVTRIYGGSECTYSQGKRFFSHRREGPTGRQATLIWISEAAIELGPG